MNMAVSAIVICGVLAEIFFILRRQDTGRRSQYGPAGLSEFRTDLAIDECMDRLARPTEQDIFRYECQRETDGSFSLHFTLHQPTCQPLDTCYSLRLDPGRQTVVTLIFVREAFGYREPVFLPDVLDAFMLQKLDAHRTR